MISHSLLVSLGYLFSYSSYYYILLGVGVLWTFSVLFLSLICLVVGLVWFVWWVLFAAGIVLG